MTRLPNPASTIRCRYRCVSVCGNAQSIAANAQRKPARRQSQERQFSVRLAPVCAGPRDPESRSHNRAAARTGMLVAAAPEIRDCAGSVVADTHPSCEKGRMDSAHRNPCETNRDPVSNGTTVLPPQGGKQEGTVMVTTLLPLKGTHVAVTEPGATGQDGDS